jgi:hypothetical protein
MKIFSTKLTVALAVLVLLATSGPVASAETLKAFATRVANDQGTNTHFFKALDDAGHTSLAFSTSVTNQLVKITYNAECGVLGPAQAWVSVTILVDGVQANPKNGTDFALCTATSASNYAWVGAVRQSLITVPAIGTHHLQVLVDLNNAATTWWLGDTSVVVEAR